MEPMILASSSPRRQEILKDVGIPFISVIPDCKEDMPETGDPAEIACGNAQKKLALAREISKDISANWILSADTLVFQENRIFGKPKDRAEAAAMLHGFSGKSHGIVTAVCLYSRKTDSVLSRISRTRVSFMQLSAQAVENYLESGEWQGAAGGYKIQGIASCFVTDMCGSWTGAVGLPVHDLYEMLLESHYDFVI